MATATAAGTFKIGGDLEVTRLGYGAMRITGEGIWGPPRDHADARSRVLERLPELGVDFIDTADSYGPHVSEDLIREALHPYDGIEVATKGGCTRTGPERVAAARPARVPAAVLRDEPAPPRASSTIDLWQLHRIDPKVPREEQFGVHRASCRTKARCATSGCREVTVEEIEAAREHFEVATVQNLYNLTDAPVRGRARLLRGQRHRLHPVVPARGRRRWPSPAARSPRSPRQHGATPGQVALAWLLQRSPVMLPIPGTGSVEHLEENVAAAELELTDDEIAALDGAAD